MVICSTGQFGNVGVIGRPSCRMLPLGCRHRRVGHVHADVALQGYGSSIALSVAIFGGFAPFIATWLIQATESPVSPTSICCLRR
jgi:hypothetical protein